MELLVVLGKIIAGLERENPLRKKLIQHRDIYEIYEKLREDAWNFSKGYDSLVGWMISLSLFVIFSSLLSFLNIIDYLARPIERPHEALFVVVVTLVTLNIIFSYAKLSYVTNSKLNKEQIQSNLKGSRVLLFISFFISFSILSIAVYIDTMSSSSNQNNSWWDIASIIISFLGFLVVSFLISRAIDIGTSRLWRLVVSGAYSNVLVDLPRVIVKTKTGNIYYGQLYDPLDSKVLVLRKSRLMHGGQIVEDKNELIPWNLWENEGDYWIIPWNDIESIKIVEEGLYAP